MIETLLRGLPYYFVFIFLFGIYRKYNMVILYQGQFVAAGNCTRQILYDHKRKRLLNYAYLILLLFFGFRGYVYTDFVNYKPVFDMLDGFNNLSEIFLLKGWEPGFLVYTALCKAIIPDYFAWNVISTIIDLFLLYKVLERYSNNHLLSLMVFFVIGSAALEFNVLRNAKAIFLFLYSLRYIEGRKMWKYFAVIGIACLFHISSILYFPFYFFLHKRWPQWILWCVCVGGLLILCLHIGFVSDIVSRMSFSEGSRIEHLASHLDNSVAYTSSFGNIERMFTMLIICMLYNKLAGNCIGNYMFINLYVCLYAVFTISSESVVMVQRFQYMFIASFWVLYPLLIKYAKIHRNETIYLFTVTMIFMKLILIGADPNLKYDNILTGFDDFDTKVNYVEKNLGK